MEIESMIFIHLFTFLQRMSKLMYIVSKDLKRTLNCLVNKVTDLRMNEFQSFEFWAILI